MLKKYNCKICNYETNRLSDNKKHLLTKKHIENEKNMLPTPHLKNGDPHLKNGEGHPKNGEILGKSKKLKGFECNYCKKWFKRALPVVYEMICNVPIITKKEIEIKIPKSILFIYNFQFTHFLIKIGIKLFFLFFNFNILFPNSSSYWTSTN